MKSMSGLSQNISELWFWHQWREYDDRSRAWVPGCVGSSTVIASWPKNWGALVERGKLQGWKLHQSCTFEEANCQINKPSLFRFDLHAILSLSVQRESGILGEIQCLESVYSPLKCAHNHRLAPRIHSARWPTYTSYHCANINKNTCAFSWVPPTPHQIHPERGHRTCWWSY